MVRICLTLLLATLLAGCALFGGSKASRALRKTPEYRAGYQDGCSSAPGPDANKRNGFEPVKDQDLFDKNAAYRKGWGAGYTACRSLSTDNVVTNPAAGPIPDQNPGNGGIP